MNSAFRILIAITCVAIIAAIAYWFFNDRSARQEAQRQQDFATARQACLDDMGQLAGRSGPRWERVENCVASGHLTTNDLQTLNGMQ